VTVWEQVTELLQPSVACQVRVAYQGEIPFVLVLRMETSTLLPQQAPGVPKVQGVPQATVKLLGQLVKTDGSLLAAAWLTAKLLPAIVTVQDRGWQSLLI